MDQDSVGGQFRSEKGAQASVSKMPGEQQGQVAGGPRVRTDAFSATLPTIDNLLGDFGSAVEVDADCSQLLQALRRELAACTHTQRRVSGHALHKSSVAVGNRRCTRRAAGQAADQGVAQPTPHTHPLTHTLQQ